MAAPSIRTSERSSFKRCQQRWWWGYVDGLKPLRDKNPLWFGQGIHLALAEWYRPGFERGPHPAETWTAFAKDESRFIPQEYEDDELRYVDALELGVEMMNNYVEEYGTDPDWDVLCTEQTFKYLVRNRKTRRLVAKYLGTFDGVYRNRITGDIWLMEHKTAAGIIITHLALDDQAGSYLLVAEAILKAAGLMREDEQIAGIMYNFLKKSKKDTRPVNEDGLRTNKPTKAHFLAQLGSAVHEKMTLKDLAAKADELGVRVLGDVSATQPPELFLREPVWRSEGDKLSMHQRIIAEVRQMEFVRETGEPTKTPTKDCSWDCDFFRMCQLHEAQEDWEVYRDNMYKKVDPYGDHRLNRKSA